MSIEIIQQQVERFLASEAPEVMTIKGGWGVGKTFAWNAYLNKARTRKRVALKKYAYVSLFGVNSLDDLRFSIFENMIDCRGTVQKPGVRSFRDNISDLLQELGEKSLLPVSTGTRLDRYRPVLNSLAFLSLENAIICLDDFERTGSNIEVRDILGLVNQLKELKRCKVVLILNDESLHDRALRDYLKLKEKVVDTELKFAPSAQDCAAIALTDDRPGRMLRENVVRLGIDNIRIIKKIESLSRQLLPLLKNYDQQVLHRALQTLSLLTWCYYSHSSDVPEFSFVIGRTRAFDDWDETENLTIQQQAWCAILRRYENFTVDDFDVQIASLVENGYLAEQEMSAQAALLQERVEKSRSENSFQDAWRKFNESFDDNAQDVIDCLSNSFKNNAVHISPTNLDGAVRLLRFLGRGKLASRIIDLYIEKRGEEVALFAPSPDALAEPIKDSEVLEKFQQAREALQEDRSLARLCELLLADDGGNCQEEQLLLAEADIDAYIALFREQRGSKLAEYIDLCLSFGRLGGATETQLQISDKATEALRLIGRESKINYSRVKRFGINLDN